MFKPFLLNSISPLTWSLEEIGMNRAFFLSHDGLSLTPIKGLNSLNAKPGVSNVVSAILTGTSAGETITGTASIDTINAEGGNDTVFGLDGSDTIYGGTGDDVLDGGAGNDSLFGDDGQDTLFGRLGADNLNGGAGDDSLYIDVFDVLDGGTILGGSGYDTVYVETYAGETGGLRRLVFDMASAGVERFVGSDIAETIDASNAATGVTIYTNLGLADANGSVGDTVLGSAYDDNIYLRHDYGSVHAGAGYDVALFTESDPAIGVTLDLGATGFETAYGGAGNDTLDARTSTDRLYLYGEGGNDLIFGGSGQATNIYGGIGDDTILATHGDSYLFGGAGNDDIRVGASSYNQIDGGDGDDIISLNDANKSRIDIDGGAGNDMLVFTGLTLQEYLIAPQFDYIREPQNMNFQVFLKLSNVQI